MTQPKIIIYTLPTCAFCEQAKDYLKHRKLKFKEISVDTNPVSQKEMVDKSGQYNTPVIDINGQIVVGFQKNILDALLAI